MQHIKRSLGAMTLVEVLVALAIVAFVFSSLTQMTFDALQRAKKLELQDKMRNYATEAVQVIYNQKDTSWKTFSTVLPPVEQLNQLSQATLKYATVPGEITKLVSLAPSECSYDTQDQVLSGNSDICASTLPSESGRKQLFGRVIIRNDVVPVGSPDLPSKASIEIVVACIKDACSARDYPPFVLDLMVYRTGGTQ